MEIYEDSWDRTRSKLPQVECLPNDLLVRQATHTYKVELDLKIKEVVEAEQQSLKNINLPSISEIWESRRKPQYLGFGRIWESKSVSSSSNSTTML